MSDILNNATRQQPFNGDPYKVAADYLDKIFSLIPTYGWFDIQEIIDSSNLSPSQKIIADYVHSEMTDILKSENCLKIPSDFGNLVLQLNQQGRDVLAAGNLTAYKTQKAKADNTSSITNINLGDNYGHVSQVGHQSSFDLDNNLPTQAANAPTTNRDQKGNWLLNILSNNWTVTIVGGVIAAIVAAYFIFIFKWNH